MRPKRILYWIVALMAGLALFGATQMRAQSGVMVYLNHCGNTDRPQIMRGDGTGRTDLLLPPLPTGARYGQFRLKDVTTRGPVSVLFHIHFEEVINHIIYYRGGGQYVVQVIDAGGALIQDQPLLLPGDPQFAAFSPTGDRVAMYNSGIVTVAHVDRDEFDGDKIIGFSDYRQIVDASTLGDLGDSSIPGAAGFSGMLDFAADGSTIVLTIYGDLWLLHLDADARTLLSAEPLTRTKTFTEWNPSFSPDGTRIAFVGGANLKNVQGVSSNTKIYVLDLASPEHTILALPGKGDGPNNPHWAPDGTLIAFMASIGSGGNSTCGSRSNRNMEIFLVPADGSAQPRNLTNSPGGEYWHRWGWYAPLPLPPSP